MPCNTNTEKHHLFPFSGIEQKNTTKALLCVRNQALSMQYTCHPNETHTTVKQKLRVYNTMQNVLGIPSPHGMVVMRIHSTEHT